uniref:uncharacterized protein LOC117609699 n=1 Tax=Osmia lignaria TaxID=473952 RepID=UPI0014793BDE|nr:uncharacterized protein LOC117609699 [Osmia lignaria]
MDRTTKERWESSLVTSTEYPKFDKLVEFITARVRILESLSTDQAKTAQPKPVPQRQAAQLAGASRLAHAAASRPPYAAAQPRPPVQAKSPAQQYSYQEPFGCSEISFISEDLTSLLNLRRHRSSITIIGVGGTKSTETCDVVDITLQSTHSQQAISMQAHVLTAVSTILPSFSLRTPDWPHIKKLRLADNVFMTPRPSRLNHWSGFLRKDHQAKHHQGITNNTNCSTFHFWMALAHEDQSNLQELFTKFWVQEESPMDAPSSLTQEEEECKAHFCATHSRDHTGRYIVRIPLKAPASLLGNSHKIAQQCLQSTLRRLAKDSTYNQLYVEFMKEYEELGHMVKASDHSRITSREAENIGPDREMTLAHDASASGGCSNLALPLSPHFCHRHHKSAVHRDDWDLQRIFWIDEDRNVIPYQLTTVTYGTKAAPFLATRALMQLVHDEGHRFPLVTSSLTHGRYVNDIFGGADSISELVEVAHQLIALCNAGGFPLAKWHATHPDLLRAVSSSTQSSTPISFDDYATKLLGIQWMPQTDTFGFSSTLTDQPSKCSKRLVLSEVARIFDPLGFVSPHISTVEIHGFSDASQLAMAAVIYITVSSPSNNSTTSIVCSKTKVTPLKRLTIPRLELSAALLLAKLAKYIQTTLKVKINATHLWTDSQVSLIWIKSQASRWKDYVRNRVIQIQELTPNAHWRHVPGTSNPADCASRGISTDQLQRLELWWKGPSWMALDHDHWPEQKEFSTLTSELEVRPNVSLFASAQKLSYHWDLIYKYSSLIKLYRLTALCFRFASRLKRKLEAPPVIIIPSCDMEKAQLFWIKATQHLYFANEIKMLNSGSTLHTTHLFCRLTAFIDSQETVRVGGRLTNTTLSRDGKHSAILPRDAYLSKIIIEDAHKRTFHGGTQLTLAYIRQRHWVIGGRAPVKSHILRCVVCARPITMKSSKGRGSKTIKGWICIFVCFSSSAVHLEVVSNYLTEGFLAAYRRFSSRRGIAHKLYSDCGTNFIGVQAELKHSTQWMFNPPAAPHMEGKWKAVVKSIKYHLRRTIDRSGAQLKTIGAAQRRFRRHLCAHPRTLPNRFSAQYDPKTIAAGSFTRSAVQIATNPAKGSALLVSMVTTLPAETSVNFKVAPSISRHQDRLVGAAHGRASSTKQVATRKSDQSSHRSRQNTQDSTTVSTMNRANQQVFSYASTVQATTFPTKDQAIVANAVEGITIKEYVSAIGLLINPSNIRFVSRISKNRVCMHLASQEIANKLTENNETLIL